MVGVIAVIDGVSYAKRFHDNALFGALEAGLGVVMTAVGYSIVRRKAKDIR